MTTLDRELARKAPTMAEADTFTALARAREERDEAGAQLVQVRLAIVANDRDREALALLKCGPREALVRGRPLRQSRDKLRDTEARIRPVLDAAVKRVAELQFEILARRLGLALRFGPL